MIRQGIILCSLTACLSLSFASWFSWARGDEPVLVPGSRFALDRTTAYLDREGYVIFSRNEHLIHYVHDLAQRVASQPALQATPRIQQALSEARQYQFAGFKIGFFSSPLPLPAGTHGFLLAIPILFVSILLGLYPAVAFVRGPLRRRLRTTQGLCIACGYSLTGNASGICPECGETVVSASGSQDFERLLRNRRRRLPLRWGSLVMSLLMLLKWINEMVVHRDLMLPMLTAFVVVSTFAAFAWWYDLMPINRVVPPQQECTNSTC